MSDTPKKIHPGEVEIDLAGWRLKLVPSITAAMNLSRRYGGLGKVLERVGAFDFDAYVQIIAQGAGVTEKGMKRLPQAVFDAGVTNLVTPLATFCAALGTGRPPDEDGETATEDDNPSFE